MSKKSNVEDLIKGNESEEKKSIQLIDLDDLEKIFGGARGSKGSGCLTNQE